MKIKLLGDVQIVQENKYSKHNYFAWPTMARLKNGKIAVVSSGFRVEHVDPFGKTVISYSEDDGKTFTCPAPVIDTPLDDRDGGICTFGEKGVIVSSFNNGRKTQLNHLHHNDKYTTYKIAYVDTHTQEDYDKYLGSTFRISFDNGVTFGELYKSPVTSPHGPIELLDGTVLWVGSTEFTHKGIQAYKINVEDGTTEFFGEIKSDGIEGEFDGKDVKKAFESSCCEPYAFQLPDGTILCQIRVNELPTTMQSESTDGGKTWSTPHLISDEPVYPPHIMMHSSGVLIYAGTRRSEINDIRVMFSKDGGKTWKDAQTIYTGFNWDLGYPSTVELEDGSLMTVFYSHYPTLESSSLILAQRWKMEE